MKIKNKVSRFKHWNSWRKNCLNSGFYKLLVLLGLANSPTFEMYFGWDENG